MEVPEGEQLAIFIMYFSSTFCLGYNTHWDITILPNFMPEKWRFLDFEKTDEERDRFPHGLKLRLPPKSEKSCPKLIKFALNTVLPIDNERLGTIYFHCQSLTS